MLYSLLEVLRWMESGFVTSTTLAVKVYLLVLKKYYSKICNKLLSLVWAATQCNNWCNFLISYDVTEVCAPSVVACSSGSLSGSFFGLCTKVHQASFIVATVSGNLPEFILFETGCIE